MTKIFISYSRQDEEFAQQIATDLDRLGASIWLDVDDIPPGVNWSSAIQQGLDTCDTLLLIISPDSMESSNVMDEWQYFRDESKPIIPVMHRSTANIHFQLRRIQYVDFLTQDYEAALIQLRGRIFGEDHALPGKTRRKAVPGVITLGSARQLATSLELVGHRDSVKRVALSPDGSLAATCSEDKTVRLWYTTGRKRIKAMIGHEKPVNTVAFSAIIPDRNYHQQFLLVFLSCDPESHRVYLYLFSTVTSYPAVLAWAVIAVWRLDSRLSSVLF